MPARNGAQYLAGLRDGRCVRVDGAAVTDVVGHPSLGLAAATMASLFDLQHAFPDDCLVEDPESGEPISVSHLIPRSKADVVRRHACLQRIAEATVGLMGRSPDYLNVTFAGFAARTDEWSAGENAAGAGRLADFQRELRRRDLALTHTIVHPTVDKALGDAPRPDNDVALRKVGETANGIVVRGSRILATLAPFSDEIAVYPSYPLPEGSDAFAVSFSIPMNTPGLLTFCRDSYAVPRDRFDYPLSSRFDEQDAFMVFDDVEVPRERVFIDANPTAYNAVMRTGWFPNIAQQTMIRAQTKLEFAHGLASRMAEIINDRSPATAEMLGEIWTYAEMTRAAVFTAEQQAMEYGDGAWFPAAGPLVALRALLPRWFPRTNEIIRLIGSHNLLATPARGDLEDPDLRPRIDHYLRGAGEVAADERIAVFRLAWDFTGSALAGRNDQYERFHLGSGARSMQAAQALAPRERGRALVDQFVERVASPQREGVKTL
jgi:4-hydroxyphenylacetate 3-monooxygenase oxygenase component